MKLKIIIIIIGIISIISCNNKDSNKKTGFDKSNDASLIKKDSIVFKTAKEKYVYLGERLYPAPDLPDSVLLLHLVKSELLSIELVKDTIFAFLNNDLLYKYKNSYLPEINDSLIKTYFTNFYEINYEDDIPYFVYLKNSKDNITLIKNKKKGYYQWEFGTIQDTIISLSGIRVGMKKEEVFTLLNFKDFNHDKSSFSLILCNASIPSKIWYKQLLSSKELLESLGYSNYKLPSDVPNLQMLLHFKNDCLEFIHFDPWIGYGKKGEIDRIK